MGGNDSKLAEQIVPLMRDAIQRDKAYQKQIEGMLGAAGMNKSSLAASIARDLSSSGTPAAAAASAAPASASSASSSAAVAVETKGEGGEQKQAPPQSAPAFAEFNVAVDGLVRKSAKPGDPPMDAKARLQLLQRAASLLIDEMLQQEERVKKEMHEVFDNIEVGF